MALLTRIAVGGAGQTYGTITDKTESAASPRPGDLYTRIAVGGVGQALGTITDKSPDVGASPRPGDIFTRIGVGGVGIHYTVTAKVETEIEVDIHTPGYYGTGLSVDRRLKEDDEIIALLMAMYETGVFH